MEHASSYTRWDTRSNTLTLAPILALMLAPILALILALMLALTLPMPYEVAGSPREFY
ncbi:hypothetical protein L211DRAFT_832643, partial [Terfezia boudieri ATCC MYA-4762]